MYNITLNIEHSDKRWISNLDKLDLLSEQIVLETIVFVKKNEDIDFLDHNKKIIINLNLSNDDEVRELNREFRNKDKATNVLSFAAIDNESFYNDIELFNEIELGDIIMSYDTLEKEAEETEKPLINHYIHLLVHGVLHLLGFDHIEDDEAEYMEEFEIDILKSFNIDNPYLE